MSLAGSRSVAPVMGGREWIMLVALATLWGGSFFFFKVMLNGHLPPFLIVLGRVGLAAVMLNIWLLAKREYMPISLIAWRDFIIMGLLNNVAPFSLIVLGEQRISSGLASILNATTPIFTIIVAHWLTDTEKLSGPKIFGIIIGFIGVAVLVGSGAISGSYGTDVTGELACLIAAISYAFAGVFGRRFRGMNPIKVATGQITGSTLVLIPIVLIFEHPWTLPMPGTDVWGAMVGIALLSTVIAYILYSRILAVAGATNLLLVTFLLPISALLLGWGLLGENIALRSIIGMAIIGLGLAAIDGRFLTWARRNWPPTANPSRSDERKSESMYNEGGGI